MDTWHWASKEGRQRRRRQGMPLLKGGGGGEPYPLKGTIIEGNEHRSCDAQSVGAARELVREEALKG